MKLTKCYPLFIILILVFLNSPIGAKEVYHMVLIPNPSPEVMLTMAELGLPLDDGHMIKGKGLEIPLEASEIELIKGKGINFIITQPDLEKYYGEICRRNLQTIPPPREDDPVHMKYGSMGGFYTFQQMVSDLDSMHLLYPAICAEKVVIGVGWDENPLYMVKISDNPGLNENEPQAIFDALHHAREAETYTSALYTMWHLLEDYGSDPEATYLIDNRELYFVPMANPDGLIYNQINNPGGGGMWRKNRRDNGGGIYGVDLNRNYPYMWGYNNIGSSPIPSSETYRGPYAASEPETQALINLINNHDFHTGMTVHSSGDLYLSAYGYANVLPEHYDVHMEYMAYAAQGNGYVYGTCYQVEYESNGRTQDYQLHEHDIINIEPEIGSYGFWPPISQIMPEAAENLNCYLHLAWCAGGLVEFSSLEVQDGYLTPASTENLIATVFNKGWGTSEAVQYSISTTDTFITLLNSTATTDTLPRRTEADNSANPFTAQVSATCPIGHEVEFTITINQGGYIRTNEVTIMVGEPVVFFQDGAESGMGNWTTTGNWGLTSSNPYSGNYSFTDSPIGNYNNNINWTMTLNNPVNLYAATSVWLEFWTHWDIELNYDFAQVEVTVDGVNWIPVPGIYTQPGSGIGVQPAGQPGYEGSQPTWVHEHMELDPVAGQPFFKVRFELKSDGGVVGDGWYLDDIKLLGFTEPVIPPAVSITLVPTNPPIIIPPGGGSFNFTATITNNDTTTANFDVWTNVLLPNGTVYGPILFRSDLTLPVGGSVFRSINQNVPAGAPPGQYEYRAFLGLYPLTVFTQDSFEFTKLP